MRDGPEAGRQAHNLEVGGSIPPPASSMSLRGIGGRSGTPKGRYGTEFLYDLWLEALWASKLALLIFIAVFAALMAAWFVQGRLLLEALP